MSVVVADAPVHADEVLAALPDPVAVLDGADCIVWVNPAAEGFFGAGAAALSGGALSSHVAADSPLMAMIAQVRKRGSGMSDHSVEVAGPRLGAHRLDVQVAPMHESPGCIVVALKPRSVAEALDRQMSHRGAARSVAGMARLLAHEVKNPLSGIRGAAQLLEQNASEPDRELTRLIRDEADRICTLVDGMDQFAEDAAIQPQAVNVHEVLGHVRRLATGGFARHVRFVERYDPSLPATAGDRNGLVQVFLNLVKNAAEATPKQGGEIVLGTAYRHGVRIHVPGRRERVSLPLEITVRDNGLGIAEEMRNHLFDAFVSTKPDGSGLGLALVAKLVRDHGGVVEFDSEPRRTLFRVRLPLFDGPAAGDEESHD